MSFLVDKNSSLRKPGNCRLNQGSLLHDLPEKYVALGREYRVFRQTRHNGQYKVVMIFLK